MKSKKVKWIAIGLAALIVFSALTAGLIILAGKANNEAEYTYAAAAEKLPEYDTDLFNIDGKLDEEIYNRLRWWDESYAEGEMQDPVRVKATSYLGKNGVYFVFDVTDDKVYVNMKRASYNNSAVTVYVAAEGTHDLNDNVWEIDILPNNFINAKRYMGGYYYASVKAKGWENQPFVCTTTKGGDINTAECTGYIMESYFPYSYLFEDGKIPENINLNFALERSYSLESDSRDVYYNFGQNVISNWSWSDPGTWWVFNKNGLDSVDLVLETGEGGSFEYRNDYIARYQTEKIKITPDDGYRIKSLTMETNGTKEDVTDRITWEDGINYIKVRNATADIKLIAEFEKIPQSRFTLSGRVTLNGGALSNEVNSDIGLRFIGGGVAYTGTLDSRSSYSIEIPAGNGVLEVYSLKYKYVAKRISLNVSGNSKNNILLTSEDYGKNRVTSLTDEQVMGNKEVLFNGTGMAESMASSFAYDFTIKYNGKMLEEDGTPVSDPTFGEFDHQYTAINHRFNFTDADGKTIDNSEMLLQIMSWDGNGMWMAKLWLDGKSVTARIGIDELRKFCSDNGVHFRIIFADSKAVLYMVRDGLTFKIKEIDATATSERYLKTLEFSADHCVNHSIWYVKDHKLSFGKTQSSYPISAVLANGDGIIEFKTKGKDGKTVRTSTSWDTSDFNGTFGWTGTLRIPGIIKNGKIRYSEMTTGYWVDTSKDGKDWYQFNVFITCDGDNYYVTKTGKTTKLQLSEEQIKLLGTSGLRVGVFANGITASFFVDNGNGEMEIFADLHDYNSNSLWFPWPNRYSGAYVLHEGNSGLGKVISEGAEFYTGLSDDMTAKQFIENILGQKYQSVQYLNPVTKKLAAGQENYFVMNHNDISENAFYGYNIKSDAADKNGNIKKTSSVYFNTKAWSKNAYYANYVKLRIASDSAYFIWQQGVSPYASSQAVYFLNKKQLALLAKGGLNVYIEYKNNSPEMNLYVDDGNGNIVLASTYKEELFTGSTGVGYVKNLIGYSVQVAGGNASFTIDATGCVISENGSFAQTVKSLYGKSVVSAEIQPDIQKIDSAVLKNADGKINNDYLGFNIGGNWFDRFNVKAAKLIDSNGEILKNATVRLVARMQGDEYYGQSMDLHLVEGKNAYIEYANYGGNWEKYRYSLTDSQLAALSSGEGLNIIVSHKANEKSVTLYVEEGSALVPLKTMEYGKNELLAKGYIASYTADSGASVNVIVDCYKYADSITLKNALNKIYGKSYTVSTVEPLRYMECINEAKKFSGESKETLKAVKYTAAADPSVWQVVLKSDAVDKSGNVLKNATVQTTVFGNNYGYQFVAALKLTQTESVLTLQEGEAGNWALHSYYIGKAQLAQLSSDKGLVLYIFYENGEISLYVAEKENTLLKALSFVQKNISFDDTRLTFDKSEASLDAEISCYTYTNGSLNDILKAAYNEKRIVREKTAYENGLVTRHEMNDPTQKVDVDYSNPVEGKWIQHFTFKINPETDGENITLSSRTMLYSDSYYQQSVNLRITESGAYLDMPEYGGNWDTYTYRLSDSELEHLYDGGLDIYITGGRDNTVTVYLAAGNELVKVKTFTYGKNVINAKGYSVSYSGNDNDKVNMTAECVKLDDSVSSVWNEFFGKEYTESSAVGVYTCSNKVSKYTKTFTADDFEGGKTSVSAEYPQKLYNDYFYRVNLKNSGIDKNGNVTESSRTTVQYQGGVTEYKSQVLVTLYLNKGSESKLEFALGESPWTKNTVVLSEKQLKAIGGAGLDIYFTHTADAKDTFTVYTADGETLQKMFTAKLTGVENGTSCKFIYSKEGDVYSAVSGEAYAYGDTDLLTALRTAYGKKYAFALETDFSRHAEVEGIKSSYKIGETVSFTVTPDSGYEVAEVKVGENTLNADKDGKYTFTFTDEYASGCKITVSTLAQFMSLEGKKNSGNFSGNTIDGKKLNSVMGTDGYNYIFHSKLKSSEIKGALISYTGWGQIQETCYAQLQKDSDGWYLYLKYYNEWYQWQDVGKKKLTDVQLTKIRDNGLNIFLINSLGTKYSLYVEGDGENEAVLVAEFVSKVSNKQIYMVEHNIDGLTTVGYFCDPYTSAEAAIGNVLNKKQ